MADDSRGNSVATRDRVRATDVRLYDRFGRHPISLVVLADEHAAWRPDTYAFERFGCELRFVFPTIKLLDYRDRLDELEASDNAIAVAVAAHLATLATRGDDRERFNWKRRLILGLYDRRFSRDDVVGLFRFIEWIMDLPHDLELQLQQAVDDYEREQTMPYVTKLERWAEERGREEGREEGRAAILDAILVGLNERFSTDPDIAAEVRSITDLQTLRDVLKALWTAESAQSLRKVFSPGN